MKQIAAIGCLLVALLVVLAVATSPVSGQGTALNTLTRSALQAGTWVYSKMQTLGAGAKFTATTTAAPGTGTYLRKDADTGCWQEWQDGALGWQLCQDGVVPPDCAATGPLEFGKFCKDQMSGEVRIKTGSGLIALTGAAR